MAENYLITGYWGEPHVTAENDRGIHAAIFGAGRYVLPVGEQFNAEYIGNNTVRLYDGKLMDNGTAAGIPAGEYVDLTITNASQGMSRNDLIVFEYSQNATSLVETGVFKVLQGTETSGTPSDPTLVQNDLLSGTAISDQMALWRVTVSGATISAPVQLFSVAVNVEAHAAKTNNPHNVTKHQVGMGTVPNVATNDQTPTYTEASANATLTSGEKLSVAFGKIAKAVSSFITHLANKNNPHGVTAAQVGAAEKVHSHDMSDLSGDLPISKGGTGATNAAEALNNLGAVSKAGGTINGELTVGGNLNLNSGVISYGNMIVYADSNGSYGKFGASENFAELESNYRNGARRVLYLYNPSGLLDTRQCLQLGHYYNDTWTNYLVPVQTDWIELTPADGVTTPGEYGNGVLRYRAEGKHVYVAGSINAAWDGSSNKLIATLPSGYRPANGNCYFLQVRGGQNVARVFIKTSGEIYIEWVKSLYDQSNNTGSGWFDLHMDFWTD